MSNWATTVLVQSVTMTIHTELLLVQSVIMTVHMHWSTSGPVCHHDCPHGPTTGPVCHHDYPHWATAGSVCQHDVHTERTNFSLPSCRYVHIDTVLTNFKPVDGYYTGSVFGSCYFYSNKILHLPNKNTEIMCSKTGKTNKGKVIS